MNDSGIPAVLRAAAAGVTLVAAGLGRVLEAVAIELERPERGTSTSPRTDPAGGSPGSSPRAERSRRKGAATARPKTRAAPRSSGRKR